MSMTVENVMTREVAPVSAATSFKDVATALVSGGVGAAPVLDGDRHVIGMISEADLLHKEQFREQHFGESYRPPPRSLLRHRASRRKASGETAADLMTSPPITITAGKSAVDAARLMDAHDVNQLAVVDYNGRLVGIVSRRDLVRLFLRGDEQIAADVRDDILRRALWMDTSGVQVKVSEGVVTLYGRMDRRSETALAIRATGRVNGVVGVVGELSWERDDVTPASARRGARS